MFDSAKERRILIAEDQEATRISLSYALQRHPGIRIVGEAENGEQVLALLRRESPHVVLMDVEMPVMGGIPATRIIKQQFPHVRVIMLTSHDQAEPVYASLTAGADAYCMKNIKIDRLLEVISMVMDGALWLDPAIAQMVMNAFPGKPPASERPEETKPAQQYKANLTEREWDVLNLIVQGKSNKDIADELCITVHTVKVHVGNILQKLAVGDRTQLAVKALQDGLCSPQ